MSESQIQTFLQSKVPTCQSGYVCLKDWYDTSRTTSADAMCGAYSGGVRERASTIIFKVAQACGINPQVLLVMLQKEQGLVAAHVAERLALHDRHGPRVPRHGRVRHAVLRILQPGVRIGVAAQALRESGRHQPVLHLVCAGQDLERALAPERSVRQRAGVHPEPGHREPVLLHARISPTPPRSAPDYGEGDSCSSYGNRNFYQYFTDWFGAAQADPLQVLQVSGTNERYLVSQGGRWRLGTTELAAQFTWISAVRDVSRADLDAYQDRGPADRAIRTTSGVVYLLDSGQRFHVRDVAQVTDFGWDYGSLPVASDQQAARYTNAGVLERVVRADGLSWLIQSGARRQVLDLGILTRYGIPAVSTAVSPAMLGEYATAAPVVAVGVYRDATNPYRLLTDGGTYVVPDAASGTPIARSARELTAESFAFLRATSTMPLRMTSGGRSYAMTESGWLEVTASHYPSGLTFTALPSGAAAGIPAVGSVNGPHFIRERSDAQTYLVSWGTLQAVSADQQAWVTAKYGVSSRVWVVLDGMIGDLATPEGLVRTAAGSAYLLDGPRAYRFRDCSQVVMWGADCAALPNITDAKLAGYANAGYLQYLIRMPSGTTWLPQGGQLRQVLDPGILAVYGIPPRRVRSMQPPSQSFRWASRRSRLASIRTAPTRASRSRRAASTV